MSLPTPITTEAGGDLLTEAGVQITTEGQSVFTGTWSMAVARAGEGGAFLPGGINAGLTCLS